MKKGVIKTMDGAKVFILGAGMSKEVGAPGVADFMYRILHGKLPVGKIEYLRRFGADEYGKKFEKVSVESLLTRIDNALWKGKPIGTWDVEKLRKVRAQLVNAMTLLLSKVQACYLEEHYYYHRYKDPYYSEARDRRLIEQIRRTAPNSEREPELQRRRLAARDAEDLSSTKREFEKSIEYLIPDTIAYDRKSMISRFLTSAAMAGGVTRFREWFLSLDPLYRVGVGAAGWAGDSFLHVRARGWTSKRIKEDLESWAAWLLRTGLISEIELEGTFSRDDNGIHRISGTIYDAFPGGLDEYGALKSIVYEKLFENDDTIRDQARYLLGESKTNPYDILFALLRPSDSIITFNYDLFADIALEASADSDQRIDYGISELTAFTLRNISGPFQNYSCGKNPHMLLKLHGTINWIRCMSCGTVYHTFSTPALAPGVVNNLRRWPKFFRRSYGGGPCCYFFNPSHLEIPLIPPTRRKSISVGFLAKIWTKAIYEIACASELIFIGYRLRESDSHVRKLIKYALDLRKSGNADHYYNERARRLAGGGQPRELEEKSPRDLPFQVTVVCGRDPKGNKVQKYEKLFRPFGVTVRNSGQYACEYLSEDFLKRGLTVD